jgi:protein arginine N-methyltransferase 1
MLADQVRTGNYRKAIDLTVRPGDVVVDIGTGTGILAFFACQAGARTVYAIEAGPAIELARQICTRNGLQDRVVFLNELSFNVILPERADVIVSETLGNMAFQEGILGVMIDARKRMLKEGGRVIPQSLQLSIVPVEARAMYRKMDLWKRDLWGLDFSPVRSFAVNNYYNFHCDPQCFLSDPQSLGRVTLSEVQSTYVKGTASCIATRGGVLDGIVGWMNVDLAAGSAVSNSPSGQDVHWSQAFFPLETPVSLDVGDFVSVAISTHDGKEWRWQVGVTRQADGRGEIRTQETQFDQSSFFGFPLARQIPLGLAAPKLSRKGEAELFLLSLVNGERTIAELERELSSRFGDRFRSRSAASAFLSEVVRRNS